MPVDINFNAVLPEIFLLCAVSVILVVDLFLDDARRYVVFWLTQASLVVCFLITLWTLSPGAPQSVFNDMVIDDAMSDVLKLATYASVAVALFYSRGYIALRGLFRGEYFMLVLFATLGMMVMISANHFLTLYLGLELMSLSLYALVALDRDSRTATEAAMKYFVLGALASGMLLYGMSMIYGATGSLGLRDVFVALSGSGPNYLIAVFGLVFVVSGIAFKLGIVPYHMWVPDVYHGAPTSIAMFIGTAPEISGFAFAIRLLASAMQPLAPDWQDMLVILALLSVVVGNVIAIAQSNLKRMLAYSAIANMGFMVIGIAAGTGDGYSAAMFYTVAYVLQSLAAFGVILLMSRAGFEADRLDDYRGLNARSPWYAFVMLLVMFSLAGLPPTVGFYAKFAVLEAALSAGYVWLVVAAVVASAIGAFYYLRIVKLMYFDEPADRAVIDARGDARTLLSANGLALLVLGVLPQPLMDVCARALEMSIRI